MINDSGMFIHLIFFKTITSTVISSGELLLLVNKSVDNIKFLNEDDTSMVPPGCRCAVVFVIAARFACFFPEQRKGLVSFIYMRGMQVNICRALPCQELC